MKTKFAAFAVCAAFAASSAMAQQNAPAEEKAPPKATKAEVQKVVDAIKADKAKLTIFCGLAKLQDQYQAAAEKNDEKKLDALDKQLEEEAKKLGPDFDRVTQSELDEETGNLLDALSKTCK
jgi:hypothetical protein